MMFNHLVSIEIVFSSMCACAHAKHKFRFRELEKNISLLHLLRRSFVKVSAGPQREAETLYIYMSYICWYSCAFSENARLNV